MMYRKEQMDEEQHSRLASFMEIAEQEQGWSGFTAVILYINGRPHLLLGVKKGSGLALPDPTRARRIYELAIAAQVTTSILLRDPFASGCHELLPDGQFGEYYDMVEPEPKHQAEALDMSDGYPPILGGTHWDDLTPEQQKEIRLRNEAMGGGSN